MNLFADVADQYSAFAHDARDSPCFEEWATSVASDTEVKAWIATLPQIKQQPNLVFAAARWNGVAAPGPYSGLRSALLDNPSPIRRTIMERATQTNEVGRLATLTPVFSQIGTESGRPLALVEAGASAGLCLYPDRYNYDWSPHHRLKGADGPLLVCQVSGEPPQPVRLPAIAWRSGLDLNPLDVNDDDAMAWLTNLVWPEQEERRSRLKSAIDIARNDPPYLVRGNILSDLRAQIDAAAPYGEVVVFHSAVIAYLTAEERGQFHALMTELVAEGACRWVSNEASNVLPEITATAPEAPRDRSTFVLGLNGQAVAWTHGHGASMAWL
ncbi:DUF2332 domain-containing protein [Pseudarthrobacter sp. J1738]|uniref:DUF2332 domain-containing protein n=1 Tax=Pseudarthrobacter sp. J1738 TaxID=3420446 RepID=UPI003D2D2137